MTVLLFLKMLGIALLYLNIVAVYHVLHDNLSSSSQKLGQILFVCFLPAIGALTIISLFLSRKNYVENQKQRKGLIPKLSNLFTLISFTSNAPRLTSSNSPYGGYGGSGGGSGGGVC